MSKEVKIVDGDGDYWQHSGIRDFPKLFQHNNGYLDSGLIASQYVSGVNLYADSGRSPLAE
jgi:hypothetical protein